MKYQLELLISSCNNSFSLFDLCSPWQIFKERVFKNFETFTGKHLKACNFIKKRLQNSFFPVDIAKFSRRAFLKNTSGGCFYEYNGDLFRELSKEEIPKRSKRFFQIFHIPELNLFKMNVLFILTRDLY